MTSNLCQHLILAALIGYAGLIAGAAEPAKEKIGLDRWSYIHADDSLSVADVNRDGLPDIVIGETKDQHRLVIYENVDGGRSWNEHRIDQGKESHKGALTVDLDGDGDLDTVSIAYFGFKDLHVWRNDNTKNTDVY